MNGNEDDSVVIGINTGILYKVLQNNDISLFSKLLHKLILIEPFTKLLSKPIANNT